MASGTTQSRGIAATSVERWAVTASISDDGRKASASQPRTRRVEGPTEALGAVLGCVSRVECPPERVTTRPHMATSAAKMPKPTENAHLCSETVRWGSTRKG